MIDTLMLINGLIICYLALSKKLTSNKKESSLREIYIGLVVLFVFIVVAIALYFTDNFQTLEYIKQGATVILSVMLIIRIVQIIKENRDK